MELQWATHSLDILPLHEQLNSHAKDCGDIEAQLQDLKDRDALPAIYTSHLVVTANAGETVLCFSIFVDGVPTTQRDGVIGWWGHCMVTGTRFLIAALRRSLHLRTRFISCSEFSNGVWSSSLWV